MRRPPPPDASPPSLSGRYTLADVLCDGSSIGFDPTLTIQLVIGITTYVYDSSDADCTETLTGPYATADPDQFTLEVASRGCVPDGCLLGETEVSCVTVPIIDPPDVIVGTYRLSETQLILDYPADGSDCPVATTTLSLVFARDESA